MSRLRHIYVEEAVAAHPRTRRVLARYPQATRIACRRYGEVFNPRAQNFRLQKREPALILARKHRSLVLPAPPGYGLGARHNYYFSHMLNCLYDCRYCFLQGMFRSAHYVLFVNYEDFAEALARTLAAHAPEPCWFYSGYDCDSLALEPLSGFAEFILPFFAAHPRAHLELRTKSTQTRALEAHPPLPNVVVAFSFTPARSHAALEHKVPHIDKRLAAMQRLAARGWPLGLRLDPLLYTDDFREQYDQLLARIFAVLPATSLHSVSYGGFRLPRGFFKTVVNLYPEEPLFAGPVQRREGMVGYAAPLEQRLLDFCRARLRDYVPEELIFTCSV